MDEIDIIAKTAMQNRIKIHDFCEVVTDKFAGTGVERGHCVWIIGERDIIENPDDIYVKRTKFLVNHMTREGNVVPEDMSVMDPSSLKKVSEDRQAIFRRIMEEDFATKVEEDEATD